MSGAADVREDTPMKVLLFCALMFAACALYFLALQPRLVRHNPDTVRYCICGGKAVEGDDLRPAPLDCSKRLCWDVTIETGGLGT